MAGDFLLRSAVPWVCLPAETLIERLLGHALASGRIDPQLAKDMAAGDAAKAFKQPMYHDGHAKTLQQERQ